MSTPKTQKKRDPVVELISRDHDQLADMFGGLSEKFNASMAEHIRQLRAFRDAGFAARADASLVEQFLDRSVSAYGALIDETDKFFAALDNNQPLPVPALREAAALARRTLDTIGVDFDAFMEDRPSLRARREREAVSLAAVGRSLERDLVAADA